MAKKETLNLIAQKVGVATIPPDPGAEEWRKERFAEITKLEAVVKNTQEESL
jgi:hypothetical protein